MSVFRFFFDLLKRPFDIPDDTEEGLNAYEKDSGIDLFKELTDLENVRGEYRLEDRNYNPIDIEKKSIDIENFPVASNIPVDEIIIKMHSEGDFTGENKIKYDEGFVGGLSGFAENTNPLFNNPMWPNYGLDSYVWSYVYDNNMGYKAWRLEVKNSSGNTYHYEVRPDFSEFINASELVDFVRKKYPQALRSNVIVNSISYGINNLQK